MSGKWLALAVGLITATTLALGAIPGPNDRRYPDYIVKPRVVCEKEGVFPHPRNCSWYYRCVDRMNIGYYWTYYFECEPGTVFADELDQCVHPFDAKYPCQPAPTTTPEPLTCEGVPGTCTTYDVCRPQKATKVLCEQIRCPLGLRSPHLKCDTGKFFDMDTRECVLPPNPADLCGYVEPAQDISVSQQGVIPCSYENLRPKVDYVTKLLCDDYILCEDGKFKGRKQLCDGYYECYKEATGWQVYKRDCPLSLLYSYDLDKCEPKPTAAELC